MARFRDFRSRLTQGVQLAGKVGDRVLAHPRVRSWFDWIQELSHDFRDSFLSRPDVQRRLAAFPLTRGVARRRARNLFDLVAGFVYTQVLYACVRLKLFDILYERPQTVATLAARLDLSEDATRRLLAAATSLQLTAVRGPDRYGLGKLGVAMVGNPGIAAMVEHHSLLYDDLRNPVALLRGEVTDTALGGYWPYAGAERPAAAVAQQVAAYSQLMAISQPMVANEVLDAYSMREHRVLLDVGGGEGAFLGVVADRAPHLRLMLFDLPAVVERARERFAAARRADRLTATGGDFFKDTLPTGADIVSLVRVLHDHNDDDVMTLLRAVRQALPENGTLLVAEPLSGTKGAEPVGDAYFGFYLMAMGRGRPRTVDELRSMLEAAGFAHVRPVRTHRPLLTSLIVAKPMVPAGP